MKHKFKLSTFPDSTFTITTSIWTGRMKLFMNDKMLEQSKEQGKPFLIPAGDGNFIKAFQNRTFGDITPSLIINEQVIQIVDKLKWYQYTMAVLPLLLCFIGGALGGLFGGPGAYLVLHIFMKEQGKAISYVKAVIAIVATYVLYFFTAMTPLSFIK